MMDHCRKNSEDRQKLFFRSSRGTPHHKRTGKRGFSGLFFSPLFLLFLPGFLLPASLWAGNYERVTLEHSNLRRAFGINIPGSVRIREKERIISIDHTREPRKHLRIWRMDYRQNVTTISGPMEITLELKGKGRIGAWFYSYDKNKKYFDTAWNHLSPKNVTIDSPGKWVKVKFRLLPYPTSNFAERVSYLISAIDIAPGGRFEIRAWESTIRKPFTPPKADK